MLQPFLLSGVTLFLQYSSSVPPLADFRAAFVLPGSSLQEMKSHTKTDLCLEVATWGVKRGETLRSKVWPTSNYHFSKCFFPGIEIYTFLGKQMIARLRLFLSGLWYALLCQFWEYEVSYDLQWPVPVRRSIWFIYGGVVYVTCILLSRFGDLFTVSATLIEIFSLQVTQKSPRLDEHGTDCHKSENSNRLQEKF